MPTSELVTRVLGVALALVEKCTLPVGELVTARTPPGQLDSSPPVAILLLVVTESPTAVTLDVTELYEVAGTKPPVVAIE